jgi:hypothetical protein
MISAERGSSRTSRSFVTVSIRNASFRPEILPQMGGETASAMDAALS